MKDLIWRLRLHVVQTIQMRVYTRTIIQEAILLLLAVAYRKDLAKRVFIFTETKNQKN